MSILSLDDAPPLPIVFIFSLGPGSEPTGGALIHELTRITPTKVYHVPSDSNTGDSSLDPSSWYRLEHVARTAEVPCVFVYDATTFSNTSGDNDTEPPNEWLNQVGSLLAAADERHEIIFVYDRSHDDRLRAPLSMPSSAPINSNTSSSKPLDDDASDSLSTIPPGLQSNFLPFMHARPILLRAPLARFNTAQVLDRLLSSLPPAPPKAWLAARSKALAQAKSHASSPHGSKPGTPKGSKVSKLRRPRNLSGMPSPISETASDGGGSPSSRSPLTSPVRSPVRGFPTAAQDASDENDAIEAALARRALVRQHFEDKIFLRPSPNDLPMDSLEHVGLQYNAALICSEPEGGGAGSALALQLCRHYACVDLCAPGMTHAKVLDAIRSSAYVVTLVSKRLLGDPWCLHLIDFVERTRGPDDACNFEKIWVREASMPTCLSPDDHAQRDDVDESSGNQAWNDTVEPLLAHGIQRLTAAGWAPAPHLPPKAAAFYQNEILVQEHATFSRDKSRSPLSRNNSTKFANGGDSTFSSSSAVLHALRQSGSLNPYGNPSEASDDRAADRMPFLSLDADDTGAVGASFAVDNKNEQDAAAGARAAAADIVAGVEKRVRVAIRSGLSQSTLFATATGLGAGMEVRESLGPSLQACSVVLNHSAASRKIAADFFFQSIEKLALVGRPLTLAAVTHLADALDHNRALNQLCLDDSSLNDDAVFAITQALIRDADPDLHTLELRRNNVSLAGAQALARTLTLNPSLTALALKPNPCHYDLRANKVLAIAILDEFSEAALAGGGLRELNGLYLGFITPEQAAAEKAAIEAAELAAKAVAAAEAVAANGGLPPEDGEGGEVMVEEKQEDVEEARRRDAQKAQLAAEAEAWYAPVLATLMSENPNEGLSTYEIAFLTRRVMLPPPAPPQWALERFLEGQKEAIARHAEAARAKAEAEAWEAEWNAAEPLTPREGDEDEEGDGNGGGGVGAQGVAGKEGAKKEDTKKNEAVEATEAETIAERVHRKEVEFMARSAPLVVISLGLSGRSLALPQVKVLAKGLTRAVALASLDLRHNPFEHDEEVYDELMDGLYASEFNRPPPGFSLESAVLAADDRRNSNLPQRSGTTAASASPKAPPMNRASSLMMASAVTPSPAAPDPDVPAGMRSSAAPVLSGFGAGKGPARALLSPAPEVGGGGSEFPLQFPGPVLPGPSLHTDGASSTSDNDSTTKEAEAATAAAEASSANSALKGGGSPVAKLVAALRANTTLIEFNALRVGGKDSFEVERTPKLLRGYEVAWLAGKMSQGIHGGFSGSLVKLNLARTGLTSRRAQLIIEALPTCPVLEMLDMRHNPLLGGHALAEPIVRAVAAHPSLHTVSGLPLRRIMTGHAPPSSSSSSSHPQTPSGSNPSAHPVENDAGPQGPRAPLGEPISASSVDPSVEFLSSSQPAVADILGSTDSYHGSVASLESSLLDSAHNHHEGARRNTLALRTLKLDYLELGPSELAVLCSALKRNSKLPTPVRSLDLSMNRICGVDKLGQGNWCKDGLEALAELLSLHGHLRSVSLYLNYLGPKGMPLVQHAVSRAAPSLRVLNLQFTDLVPSASSTKQPSATGKANPSAGELLASLRKAAETASVNLEM